MPWGEWSNSAYAHVKFQSMAQDHACDTAWIEVPPTPASVSPQLTLPFSLVLLPLVWLWLLEKDVHTPIEEGGRKNLRNTMFL